MRFLALLVTSVVVVSACGDDGTHHLGQLQVSNAELTTAEDTPLSVVIPVTAGSDVTLTVTVTTQPQHGTITSTADALTWTYTPALNYDGSDSLDVSVSDGNSSADGTVTITVTPVDDAPVANADTFSVSHDAVLTIPTSQLLANDTDVDNTSSMLSVTAVTGALDGTVALSADNQTVTFTPTPAFIGNAGFMYTVSDGTLTAVGMVTVTVIADAAPIVIGDSLTTLENQTLTVAPSALLANDSDPDGDALTVTSVTSGSGGTTTLSADGTTITFVPTPNTFGAASFTYAVSDGTLTTPGLVTVDVTHVNQAPVAVADTLTTLENVPGVIDVAANDSDVDGDTLSVIANTAPANGTVVFAGTVATYTPTPNFNGSDAFSYTISDGNGGTASANVAITVTHVNQAPVANADLLVTLENAPGSVDVLANDTDVDGDTLTITAVTQGASGAVTFAGPSVTYTPALDFHGTDSFTYTVSDGNGGIATGTVGVTVTHVNQAPVAVADALTTPENQAGSVNVLANDSDVDGDTLAVSAHTNGAHGTVAFSGGTATYTPALDFNGADSFSYTISDGHGGTASAAVAVTVTHVNQAPVAVNDALTTAENSAGSVNVLANDTDVDGDTLTIASVTQGAHGTVTFASPNATYTPATNFNGTDSFTYSVSDGHGGTATGTVAVTVTHLNQPPVANTDTLTTPENQAGSVNVLANDTDVDGDTLSVTAHTNGAHGVVAFTGGTATYSPAANFNGADAFTYTISDGHGGTATGTVNVTVTHVNQPPVAANDAFGTPESTALTIAAATGVLANDSDPDGDTLTAALVSTTTHGTLALAANGGFTYTPTGTFVGTDSFTYKASDGALFSNVATVAINVTAVEHAPVAVNDAFTTAENTALSQAAPGVLANDTDADGDTLTAILVANPAHGTLVFNSNGSFKYTPATNFNGTDSFTYKANDGQQNSGIATATITVTHVNQAPVAVADTFATNENVTLTVPAATGVLANDSDPDGDTLTAVIVATTAHGTLTLASNGGFTYVPTNDFNGVDSFTYKASDGALTSAVVTATINVAHVNQPPVAVADAFAGTENVVLSKAQPGVLANDTDPDGDALTAVLVSTTAHGTLTLNANGSFVYTPVNDFNGTDSFTYKANDGTVNSTTAATVTLTIAHVNQAPVAVNDTLTTAENVAGNVNVLANDSDVDGDTLTVSAHTNGAHGTVAFTGGVATYTPATNFNGTDSFGYTISDGHGLTASATVAVTVTHVNQAPVAVADAFTTAENVTLNQSSPGVLGNDTDVDGDTLTAVVVATTTHGTLTLQASGAFTYVPTNDFHGTDSFTYKANDGALDSNVVTVTITVTHVNQAPVAVADAYTATENATLTVPAATGVLANDTDVDGDTLTAVIVATTTHGTLTLAATADGPGAA